VQPPSPPPPLEGADSAGARLLVCGILDIELVVTSHEPQAEHRDPFVQQHHVEVVGNIEHVARAHLHQTTSEVTVQRPVVPLEVLIFRDSSDGYARDPPLPAGMGPSIDPTLVSMLSLVGLVTPGRLHRRWRPQVRRCLPRR
jgi:hypothetical protein